jgi:predicted transcriptional regulator
MANRSYAIHTSEENIRRLDQHAERLDRSRNWLLNEALEMYLEHLDADYMEQQTRKYPPSRKKAGTR